MKGFTIKLIIASLFAFCLIPISLWFHSLWLKLALGEIEVGLGNVIYGLMIAIYVVSLIYFIFSTIVYLINDYRLIKNLEPMKKSIKSLYITNYFMIVINLFLPLLIGKIAYPPFDYNFNLFIFGNAASILGLTLLQIIYGDIYRTIFMKKELFSTKEVGNI